MATNACNDRDRRISSRKEHRVVAKQTMEDPLLTIELVPKTSWCSNVRSRVSKEQWDMIRRDVYQRAGYKCEVCGGKGPEHPVECHEKWAYHDDAHVQELRRMPALCPSCHRVKHIGKAAVDGKMEEAIRHLKNVNGWTVDQAGLYVERAFKKWRTRSQHRWTVDTSILEEQFDVTV